MKCLRLSLYIAILMVLCIAAFVCCPSTTDGHKGYSLVGSTFAISTSDDVGSEVALYDVSSDPKEPVLLTWKGATSPLISNDTGSACMRLAEDRNTSLSMVETETGKAKLQLNSGEDTGFPVEFSNDSRFLITRRIEWAGGLGAFQRVSVFSLKDRSIVGIWDDASFSLVRPRLFYVESSEKPNVVSKIMFLDCEDNNPPNFICDGYSAMGTADNDICLVASTQKMQLVNVATGSDVDLGEMYFVVTTISGKFCFVDSASGEFMISDISQPLQRQTIDRSSWPGQAIESVRRGGQGFLLHVSSGDNPPGWIIYLNSNGDKLATLWSFKEKRRVDRLPR